jgi:hypothetical protein
VLLAVLVLAAAGCGSSKNAGPVQYTVTLRNKVPVPFGPITVKGTETTVISNVKTGTVVRCKGGPSVKVPPPGSGADVGEGRSTPSGTGGSSREMRLTHLENGTVTVSCTHSH